MNMKGFTTFLNILLFPLLGMTQTLETGITLGTSYYMGDLNSAPTSFVGFHPALGAQLRYQYDPNLALRLNLLRGEISGDDQNFANRQTWNPNLSFESSLTEVSILGEYHPFNKSRLYLYDINGKRLSLAEAKKNRKVFDEEGTPLIYKNGYFITYEGNGSKLVYDQFGNLSIYNKSGILMNRRFKPIISPYAFSGIGVSFSDPKVKGLAVNPDEIKEGDYNKAHFTIPFGFGLRYEFHQDWSVAVEGGVRAPFTDYLDGVSETRNPQKGDWYMSCGVTINYKIGNKKPPIVNELDQDEDGISDDYDRCPTIPGSINLFGCPDKDNDGVADNEDLCPDLSGIAEFGGCPDSDGDKVSDDMDTCPNIPGSPLNKGCPLIQSRELEALEVASIAVSFERGTAKLNQTSFHMLEQVANVLHNYPNYKLQIEGHVFGLSSESLNKVLSENRALSCKDFLVQQGIAANRIAISAYGASKPLTKAEKNKGKTLNSRVEFRIMLKK